MATVTNGHVSFEPEELAKTAIKYRKELLTVPFLAMSVLLQHVTTRQGIRYKEVIAAMSGNFEFGNYKDDKLGTDGVNIEARTLETFFGNCIEQIDPNAIYQSLWGADVTKGEGLKNTEIARAVAMYAVKSIWEKVLLNVFTAKHDPSDTASTEKWFNGFKTIIDKDIAGTNELGRVLISAEKEHDNLFLLDEKITAENAEDMVKAFYWSIDPKLRNQKTKFFVSDKTYHFYTDSYQMNHGSLPYNLGYDKKTLDGASNTEFVPLSFVPDDFMLITPKSNILALYNTKTEDENYLIEKSLKSHYKLDFVANAFFGTQFQSVRKENFKVAELKPGV